MQKVGPSGIVKDDGTTLDPVKGLAEAESVVGRRLIVASFDGKPVMTFFYNPLKYIPSKDHLLAVLRETVGILSEALGRKVDVSELKITAAPDSPVDTALSVKVIDG